MEVPSSVSHAGKEAVSIYLRSLASGATERFAEMVALQAPPGTRGSDRAFMEGRMNNQQLDDMPLRQANWLLREARAAGINPSGKVYVGGLADGRGHRDPEAWVSGVDDVARVARKRNLHVEGAVKHEGHQVPPRRRALSERIIQEEMRKNPGWTRGEVIDKKAHPKKKRDA
jgi:hypothetical protein